MVKEQLQSDYRQAAEAYFYSILGSEHCSYKSSKALLKSLPSKAPDVILGPGQDAGVLRIARDKQGRGYGLVLSHESHNHPSQVLPYEGAATGVGGNVRDVNCMGAELLALGNGLRFGPLDQPESRRRCLEAVAGIADYANAIGIPMLAGDIGFDPGYSENCLVTVVALGLVEEAALIPSFIADPVESYSFLLVGKAADRSGFAGAAFASADLEAEQDQSSSVQIPDPFLKRELLRANQALFTKFQARGALSRVAFKDLGAGGLACASFEMAAQSGLGASLYLDAIPRAMDLNPLELLFAETQERFLWLLPADLLPLALEHYNEVMPLAAIAPGAQATLLGETQLSGRYQVQYQQQMLLDLEMDALKPLESALPSIQAWPLPPTAQPEDLAEPLDYTAVLVSLLSHPQIASRAAIYAQFDKQVGGRSYLQPGQASAGLLLPFYRGNYPVEIQHIGIALSLDQNPGLNRLSPYWGAAHAVVEALRNIVCTGAYPLGLTDCLCFGNPEIPAQLAAFAEAIRGIADAAAAIGVYADPSIPLPVLGGNVSFYNTSQGQSIPPSPMIAMLGKIDDYREALSAGFKHPDSLIILLREEQPGLAGSVYEALYLEPTEAGVELNLARIGREYRAVLALQTARILRSAQDIAEGGLAVALVEMSLPLEIGFTLTLPPSSLAPSAQLFGEAGGFLLEIAPESLASLEKILQSNGLDYQLLGRCQIEPCLVIEPWIKLPIAEAKKAFEQGLGDYIWQS